MSTQAEERATSSAKEGQSPEASPAKVEHFTRQEGAAMGSDERDESFRRQLRPLRRT